ncbi:DNA topoisomerase I [Porphyromonadaceae bacterium COT-184 OH4590]|nr:DNA topoisomerase I [Porphyromonadaceae bacterium COT-184 OH4590]
MQNLVIVESPAKSKTIQGYLGKDFVVKSSMGHIRTLADKEFEGEITKKYTPTYEVLPEKKKVVSELKKDVKNAQTVWLATDEDREGEAIAWHLFDELKLKEANTRRIVFHEITKDAIQKAVASPRNIDLNLVDAQQARSVLDKIVGFELSPVLWRKVKNGLSAGRVQSVTVRLVVEKERDIQAFKPTSYYKIVAVFTDGNKSFRAELKRNFATKEETLDFLELCKKATFKITKVETNQGKRTPAPPFTTSTLQQEASRKLGFSVSQTMRVAQTLYEAGKITYMRTDSVNLSDLALATTKAEVISIAGNKYHKLRKYTTKIKGAQEAHEAIRPTYMNTSEIDGTTQEKRLYSLIWKRTIASQMADALIEKTNVEIAVSSSKEVFVATGEVIKFDGFLKVYMESRDDDQDDTSEQGENLLPSLKTGQSLDRQDLTATQTYTRPPFRYSEASLVKKLEELGIGRPSTYAPTISTIQNRGYVEKKDIPVEKQETTIITLKKESIKEEIKASKTTFDKGKLVPTDIGMVVNDFLIENFPQILDYGFTANIEGDFDNIAEGKMNWRDELISFYEKFHPEVDKAVKKAGKTTGERFLGNDPKTGRPVFVRIGRFGTLAQIGDSKDEEKPVFAAMQKGQSLETITLEEALELFKLPLHLGSYQGKELIVATGRFGAYLKFGDTNISLPKGENPLEMTFEKAVELVEKPRLPITVGKHENEDVIVAAGRFGAYIKFGAINVSIPRGENPFEITLERAVELIKNKTEGKTATNTEIKVFENEDIRVLNGRYGAYISHAKKNYKIPKDLVPEQITLEQAKEIVSGEPAAKRKSFKKSTK